MDDAFTKQPDFTPYDHLVPGILLKPPVDPTLVTADERGDPRIKQTEAALPLHDASWWIANTAGMDFSHSDALKPEAYNRVLWAGIVGDGIAFPEKRDGTDLRVNRAQVLQDFKVPVASN